MSYIKTVIVDYGMGNLGSIVNMLEHVGGFDISISYDRDVLLSADLLILPGVGKFDTAMNNLNSLGLKKVICDYAQDGVGIILGICLGFQLLFTESDEGIQKGLGLLNSRVKSLKKISSNLIVPHMGWNTISTSGKLEEILPNGRYYFVHSYFVDEIRDCDSVATTNYSGVFFTSAILKDNIIGAQFHPEKSHSNGIKFFTNIRDLCFKKD